MRCTLIIALGLFAAGALLPAANPATQQLNGSWMIQVTFDKTPPGFPPSFPVMHTFFPNGSVIETSSLPPEKAPGHGNWIRIGDREFRYTLQFFVTDNTGTVTGLAVVRSKVTIDDDQSKLTGVFIGDIYDFKGNQLLHSTGTYQGKRIEVDLNEPE